MKVTEVIRAAPIPPVTAVICSFSPDEYSQLIGILRGAGYNTWAENFRQSLAIAEGK